MVSEGGGAGGGGGGRGGGGRGGIGEGLAVMYLSAGLGFVHILRLVYSQPRPRPRPRPRPQPQPTREYVDDSQHYRALPGETLLLLRILSSFFLNPASCGRRRR